MSAIWEVVCSLRVLREPGSHAVHLPWIRRVAPAVRALAETGSARDREYFRLLVDLVGSATARDYLPDLLTPQPVSLTASVDDDLDRLCVADQMLRYWQTALAPNWAQIADVNDADIFRRGQQLANHGTAHVLNDLHERVGWDGSELQVAGTRCLGSQALDGGGLCLVPSVLSGPRSWSSLTPKRRGS